MKATGWMARVEFLVGIKLSSSPPHLVTWRLICPLIKWVQLPLPGPIIQPKLV